MGVMPRHHPLTPIFNPGKRKGEPPIGAQIGEPVVTYPPPLSLTPVGTPFTGMSIPYYGDYDLGTQHLILGDVGSGDARIIDCSTNNPSQLSATNVLQGYLAAVWGQTSARAFYLASNPFGSSFREIWPMNTASHSSPTLGTSVPLDRVSMIMRHGAQLIANNFSNTSLYTYDISTPSTPTLRGSVSGASGRGWGDPNDADTFYACRGSTIVSVDIGPSTPTIIQTLTLGGSYDAVHCVVVDDTLYFVGNSTFGLVDVSNPASMSVLGAITNVDFDGGGSVAVEPNGFYAYCTSGAGSKDKTFAIDCRNTASPSVAATYSNVSVINNPMDLFVDGDRLIVINQKPSIQILAIGR